MAKFIVVADAVTVAVGQPNAKGVVQYTRVQKGREIEGEVSNARIQFLLNRKAIKHVKSAEERDAAKAERHRTAKEVAAVQGAPDDPVQAPEKDVEPIPAPIPETDPEVVTGKKAKDSKDSKES